MITPQRKDLPFVGSIKEKASLYASQHVGARFMRFSSNPPKSIPTGSAHGSSRLHNQDVLGLPTGISVNQSTLSRSVK